jgi:hypothetical protein
MIGDDRGGLYMFDRDLDTMATEMKQLEAAK